MTDDHSSIVGDGNSRPSHPCTIPANAQSTTSHKRPAPAHEEGAQPSAKKVNTSASNTSSRPPKINTANKTTRKTGNGAKSSQMNGHAGDIRLVDRKTGSSMMTTPLSAAGMVLGAPNTCQGRNDPVPQQEPPNLDQIEATISQLEQFSLMPRFERLKSLIHWTSLRQITRIVEKQDAGEIPRVVYGEWVDADHAIVAISALTEAIQHAYCGKGENNQRRPLLYTLISMTTLFNAKQRPVPENAWDNARVSRPRSTLMFPWVYDPREYLTGATSSKSAKIQEAARERLNHIILVTVDFYQTGKSIPFITIEDSSPEHLAESERLWKLVKREIRKTVSNFAICDFPTVGKIRLPSSDELIFEEELEVPVAIQTNNWACGIHVILNAWSHAMQLSINPECKLDEDCYRMAVDIINLVIDGRASTNLIARFLIETGFVKFPANRRYRYLQHRIGHYHDLRNCQDIDEQLYVEKALYGSRIEYLRDVHCDLDLPSTTENASNAREDPPPPEEIMGGFIGFVYDNRTIDPADLASRFLRRYDSHHGDDGEGEESQVVWPSREYMARFHREYLQALGLEGDNEDSLEARSSEELSDIFLRELKNSR